MSARLNPGGIVSQWIHASQAGRKISLDLVHTLQSIFPRTSVWVRSGAWVAVGHLSNTQSRINFPQTRELFKSQLVRDDLRRINSSYEDVLSLFDADEKMIEAQCSQCRILTDDQTWADFEVSRQNNLLGFGDGQFYYFGSLTSRLYLSWMTQTNQATPIDYNLDVDISKLAHEETNEPPVMEQMSELPLDLKRLIKKYWLNHKNIFLDHWENLQPEQSRTESAIDSEQRSD